MYFLQVYICVPIRVSFRQIYLLILISEVKIAADALHYIVYVLQEENYMVFKKIVKICKKYLPQTAHSNICNLQLE